MCTNAREKKNHVAKVNIGACFLVGSEAWRVCVTYMRGVCATYWLMASGELAREKRLCSTPSSSMATWLAMVAVRLAMASVA